ncbi:hypothetical protein ACWDRR_33380 [Kitasatospora sp. NPDC003701]
MGQHAAHAITLVVSALTGFGHNVRVEGRSTSSAPMILIAP